MAEYVKRQNAGGLAVLFLSLQVNKTQENAVGSPQSMVFVSRAYTRVGVKENLLPLSTIKRICKYIYIKLYC
jgi:hypothetical protein